MNGSARRLITACALGWIAVTAGAQSWTFDSGDDGWQVIELAGSGGPNWTTVLSNWTPTYSASGGESGGYISALDNSSATAFAFERTVAGGFAAYDGGSLQFSLRTTISDWTGDRYVALLGNSQTIIADMVAVPAATWTSYTLGLHSVNFRYNSPAGAPVSTADFAAILNDLRSIRIAAEFGSSGPTGPFETTSLDSVSFAAIPEPSTYAALLGGAVLALAAARRYRRR